MERDCWSNKKSLESNIATSSTNEEESWDVEALLANDENVPACEMTTKEKINYENDWILDSGCSNHLTDDKHKMQNLSEYVGNQVVVTAENSKLSVAHIEKTTVIPWYNQNEVSIKNVYHVPGMKKNGSINFIRLLYVVFGPNDVKVFQDLNISENPTMQGKKLELVYVMSVESAYLDKTRRNGTSDL